MPAATATRLGLTVTIVVFLATFASPNAGWAATQWRVSTYNAVNLDVETPNNLAAWCGKIYATCSGADGAGGYGNNWHEALHYTAQIADPSQATDITLDAVINYDVEPGHDYVRIVYYTAEASAPQIAAEYDGFARGATISLTIHYDAFEYLGNGGDLIRIAVVVDTDGAWSDEDCLWPTVGAVQFDNAQVSITNGDFTLDTFDDFQGSGFGNWTPGSARLCRNSVVSSCDTCSPFSKRIKRCS